MSNALTSGGVPVVETFALLAKVDSAQSQPPEDAEHFDKCVMLRLATGSDGPLAEDAKPAESCERFAEFNFLGDIETLVKSADGFEGVATSEDKAAGGPAIESRDHVPHGDGLFRPTFGVVIECNQGAASDNAAGHGVEGGPNKRSAHESIRIDENQDVAGCDSSAGVSNGGDFPQRHGLDASAAGLRDLGGRIG